ncbi:Pogo transposable element with KRAB domain [Stylophora pistillata]|uniref:Pogo transposable element with KRAB domain n=1 Tax=Stylophora pistillata TaxID=50429 RepID=A0A2B4R8U9_STYPI|nr:Pogo transposable element with KRAB domain [Stylophora pistillata]
MAEKRKNYDLKFKLSAIRCAEETSNREAGRKFSVDESMIRRWRKNSSKISSESSSMVQSKKKRLSGTGRKPVLGDLEEELLEKIIDEREKHHHVPCKLVNVWVQELATAHNLEGFRASRGWLFNFMRRSNLSVRRRTTTGQTMLKGALQKSANFVKFCEKQRSEFNFSLRSIANMDETPIWVDILSETTVEQRGSKTIPIKSTGHEKQRITVCLAVKVDGSKLKPFVFIPGKKVKSDAAAVTGAIVKWSPNGWMNDDWTKIWVDEVRGSKPQDACAKVPEDSPCFSVMILPLLFGNPLCMVSSSSSRVAVAVAVTVSVAVAVAVAVSVAVAVAVTVSVAVAVAVAVSVAVAVAVTE